ncbi:MAG: transporter substrate-binding domain-containing protein [Kiritimatiellia bacterium]|jgi:ABC-type amino acid transport substrate-binding protein
MKKCLFAMAAATALLCGCAKNDHTITMITESGFAPYEYFDGKQIEGVDVDICRAIAAKLGKELVIRDAKFDAVIPSVIAGKADLAAAGITITEDRKQSVDFSIPYVTSGIVIISRTDEPVDSIEGTEDKVIGVQGGTTSDIYCVETLKREPQRFDNPPIAVAALKAGKVDFVIADIDPAKNCVKGDASIAITSDFLTKEEFAIAIKKGQPELLATINEVIEELLAEGAIEASKARHDENYAKIRGAEEAAE